MNLDPEIWGGPGLETEVKSPSAPNPRVFHEPERRALLGQGTLITHPAELMWAAKKPPFRAACEEAD